ncbi:MAG: MoxR family ATPase [Armatimonadetes bacterium]|nr:MoxR family ATPase [Armatimonadota bacterium]
MTVIDLTERTARLIERIETVIVGKHQTVRLTVAGLLCGGHILIEDIPGVGKTMLARALAKALECEFRRIQFTPDLLPADVLGVSIYNQATGQFEFREGPIFANVVLADEINRATPKSQSALLEAMEEFQVTVDGRTRELPRPFFVIATENPIEYEGTYSLPEAQLDRFLMRVSLGYPSPADEVDILSRQVKEHPIHRVTPVLSQQEVAELQDAVRDVAIDDSLKEYAVQLVDRTRSHAAVQLGASPRGSLALMRCGQAVAAIAGRTYVIPEDIQSVAHAVLGHRVIVKPEQRIRGVGPEQVVGEILRAVDVPILVEPV